MSSGPLVSAVNHMAARTFREREKKNRSLTWITGKELERGMNNNGDQFR